ncbi:hypothetical protein HMPREF9432_00346 [Selenomonas noxia F0398]|uniref:Uncharacterized protein n=1 Tax=Selenomonas noxia F0398 TaxID=702437 RepID=A0ABN0DS55_9FIRM|nr:hypothetical protein HMPREF9432_00346 [Selenomonas noxia F0398]
MLRSKKSDVFQKHRPRSNINPLIQKSPHQEDGVYANSST